MFAIPMVPDPGPHVSSGCLWNLHNGFECQDARTVLFILLHVWKPTSGASVREVSIVQRGDASAKQARVPAKSSVDKISDQF